MIVTTDGTGPRNSAKLEDAARFFAAQLMHGRMVNKMEIDIEVEQSMELMGECIAEDDHKNPRYFTIRLRKQPVFEMIRILAHEMVHVKQYAKNELSTATKIKRGRGASSVTSMWKGEWWEPKSKEDAYWDAPWEREAYGLENSLLYKWGKRHDPKSKWFVKK